MDLLQWTKKNASHYLPWPLVGLMVALGKAEFHSGGGDCTVELLPSRRVYKSAHKTTVTLITNTAEILQTAISHFEPKQLGSSSSGGGVSEELLEREVGEASNWKNRFVGFCGAVSSPTCRKTTSNSSLVHRWLRIMLWTSVGQDVWVSSSNAGKQQFCVSWIISMSYAGSPIVEFVYISEYEMLMISSSSRGGCCFCWCRLLRVLVLNFMMAWKQTIYYGLHFAAFDGWEESNGRIGEGQKWCKSAPRLTSKRESSEKRLREVLIVSSRVSLLCVQVPATRRSGQSYWATLHSGTLSRFKRRVTVVADRDPTNQPRRESISPRMFRSSGHSNKELS